MNLVGLKLLADIHISPITVAEIAHKLDSVRLFYN
jgi:hypothetical protein